LTALTAATFGLFVCSYVGITKQTLQDIVSHIYSNTYECCMTCICMQRQRMATSWTSTGVSH